MGKPRGKRNTKVKLAGVLSDVVTKINFKMATKDKWGGKRGLKKIRGSQVWHGAAITSASSWH